MTQQRPPRKAAPRPVKFTPSPGMSVRCSDRPEIGLVVESDDWWDTLLIRGVDISDQVLVEWRRDGQPIRRWERSSLLVQVPVDTNGTADEEVQP